MELKDLSEVEYNPKSEQMLNVIRTKTQNLTSDTYFRGVIAFYLSQMASSMRATIDTPHRGKLPINMFMCGLMSSGSGKGFSMNIIERELISGFSQAYMQHTFPSIAEQAILNEARRKSVLNMTEEADEIERLTAEFNSLGSMPYSFDSGTAPAYKQVRTKAQIATTGSLNLIIDEIGTNLLSNAELFAVSLEAYDLGLIKQKIIKNSSENKRSEERHTPVPSNMLVFGTPVKLFNGGIEEREYRSLLDTGYGRRFLYGWGTKDVDPTHVMTAEEMFEILTEQDTDEDVSALNQYFAALADEINHDREIKVSKHVALINLQYQLNCEHLASKISDFEPILKAEMQHRYFKALKLAGAYAFAEQTNEITEAQMYAAIKLVEDSGQALKQILNQDKNYVRLAKYIAALGKECTYADLSEDLPFFTGSKSAKDDMVSLARAWGSTRNIVIRKSYDDGFEILKGETLTETDLEYVMFSASDHVAYNYHTSKEVGVTKWEDFHKVATKKGVHWANHAFKEGHRKEENAIPEFNMVVIDVDEGIDLATAKLLMEKYTAFYYTTKRHTDEANRFRIILPLKYHLKMSASEYKEFMRNIFDWLPFSSDEETGTRSKKWESFNGESEYISGELLDPTEFIPKTTKNEKRIEQMELLGDMGRVESWFARNIGEGNRNNTILKLALMLLDSGLQAQEVEDRVIAFNDKLKHGLPSDELRASVLKTLWSKATDSGRI